MNTFKTLFDRFRPHSPRFLSLTALGRLLLAGLPIAVAGMLLSDGRQVEADEGKSIQLPGPSMVQSELPPARVVVASGRGMYQVMRNRDELAGPVTVVTGFSCPNEQASCRLIGQGAFREAAAGFREDIAAGRDGASVRCGLGGSLFLQGDLAGAARAYAWAEAGYPRHPDVQNGLGNVYAELAQPVQAADEFRSLASQPGYGPVAHNNLGNVYRRISKLPEALGEYGKALQLDPALAAAHYNRGGTLLEMGQYDEAAQSFHEAAIRAPDFSDAYLYEGLARLRSRQPVLAAVAFYRARELGVRGPALDLGLGVVTQELNLDEEAAGHFRRLLSASPDDDKGYQMLAMSLVKLGKLGEAAEALEQGFLRGAQDADSCFSLGLKLLLCERPQKAAQYLMLSVSKGRRGAETFFAVGQALLQSGEVEGAVKTLSYAAKLNPQAPEIHLSLGIALRYQGASPDDVLRELRSAVTLDPSDLDNRAILMSFLRDKGRFAECAAEGIQIIDANPELVAPRFETALCRALAGDLDHGAEMLEDALDHDVDGNGSRQALKKLSVLVEASKNLPGPHLLLALVYERRGNWSEAMRQYEWLMRTAPTAEWRQKALARIHGLLPSP